MKKKASNIEVAIYINNTYGEDVEEEKLIKIAKAMNLKPKVLIKNYNAIKKINSIFKD